MKTSFSAARNADIYLAAGSYDNLNNDQVKRFTINPGDDYITYNISLSTIKEYTGTVKKFRLDFNAQKGEDWFREMCGYTLYNDGTREEFRKKCAEFLDGLLK
jgi:hypothetical protein